MFLGQRYTGTCEQVTAFWMSQRASEGQQQGFHPDLPEGFGGRLQQTRNSQRQACTTGGHTAADRGPTYRQTTA